MENINHLIDQLLGLPFAVGLIFSLVGMLMWLFPPRKINYLYGYRTRSSMASQQRWDFAQKYSARLMAVNGLLLVLSSLIKMGFNMSISQQLTLGVILILAAVIVLIVLTEKAIQTKFPQA
ncbi:SdpI family protein [Flavobacterium sp. CYK-4]|uniref:SdpI family protein n=1 Tax=Flavobacterium lotistagni TaxID=2709660 RepID=UPI001408A026|nr:SdpI family protein [Flavobacterium lotistagni]NHM06137.1 SdpI family protein [Flavobacterium lotistagni]